MGNFWLIEMKNAGQRICFRTDKFVGGVVSSKADLQVWGFFLLNIGFSFMLRCRKFHRTVVTCLR